MALEGRILDLETKVAVTTIAKNNLRMMVDDQEQHSR